MRFARSQIGAFGGDDDNFMIFGESGGGTSIINHLIMPTSNGLFKRALSESGAPLVWPQTFALTQSTKFAAAAGCKSDDKNSVSLLECMRGLDVSAISNAQIALLLVNLNALTTRGVPWWNPSVDGVHIPRDPLHRLVAGEVNDGFDAFVGGTNTDEATMFVSPYYPNGMNRSVYEDFVPAFLGSHGMIYPEEIIEEIFNTYPCATGPYDCTEAVVRLVTDAAFACGTRLAVKSVRQIHTKRDKNNHHGSSRAPLGRSREAYEYHWDYRAASDHGDGHFPDSSGIYHSIELPFVFFTGAVAWNKSETALGTQIGGMWAKLAASGSPNGPSTAPQVWPPFKGSDQPALKFALPQVEVQQGYRHKECVLWHKAYAAGKPAPV
jgi:para-nitrobenzyl esterase